MSSLLVVNHLSKFYKKRKVVDSLSFEVEKKTIYGFLGPNGAGKSTTIRMILGLVIPDEGNIIVNGYPNTDQRALQHIGAIIESPSFYKYLTGRENLQVAAELYRLNRPSYVIDEVLELVDLKERADDPVEEYSHGMRQRLGLAQTLLCEPSLVILDEPTDGLDPLWIIKIKDILRRLCEEKKITIFLSSHLLNQVEEICDWILIISRGKKICEGRVKDLLGKQNLLEIKLSPIEKGIKILKNMGYKIEINSNLIRIKDLFINRLPDLLNEILRENINILSITFQKRHLEELFLEYTQEN